MKAGNSNTPSVSVAYSRTGKTQLSDELGMRPMQAEAWKHRGEQYLLLKSPPASGKSRALMFIALDKVENQGLNQAIICVPERAIGSSFNNEPLSHYGFWADWEVRPNRNLCNASGNESGSSKVKAVGDFLHSGDKILICTHATFRFAVAEYGIDAFDNRLIAIDEFHHVSSDTDNILGRQLEEIIKRDKTHMVAMTGSYFRGDADPILSPEDELKFDVVTYTYYQQLNGYKWLKNLDIGYFFYSSGSYLKDLLKVLNPDEKTIIHIPHPMSREAEQDKIKTVECILDSLGEWIGPDAETGFQLIKRPNGHILKVADLVDDESVKRGKVSAALKSAECKAKRDFVDIIIALGMAKEGFDWIWCEHALTIGYRASLTEIVQIIGRATRDAPNKTHARFTNLIAELDASKESVTEAVNDTLKAISASLLMEQVLAPTFEFRAKQPGNQPIEGYAYDGEFDAVGTNVGINPENGNIQVEIAGLVEPKSEEAKRVCESDLQEVIASFLQNQKNAEQGLFDENQIPEELTQLGMAKIVKERYPNFDEGDQEAIRQRAVAAINLTQQATVVGETKETNCLPLGNKKSDDSSTLNNAFIKGVRKFVMDVRELDIDLIDHINPFSKAYAILSKTMSEESLREVAAVISAKRANIPPEEARELATRALKFKQDRDQWPSATSQDPWEQRMKAGIDAFVRYKKEGRYDD